MALRYPLFILVLALIRLPGIAQEYQNQPEYKRFPCPKSSTGCYESFKAFNSGSLRCLIPPKMHLERCP